MPWTILQLVFLDGTSNSIDMLQCDVRHVWSAAACTQIHSGSSSCDCTSKVTENPAGSLQVCTQQRQFHCWALLVLTMMCCIMNLPYPATVAAAASTGDAAASAAAAVPCRLLLGHAIPWPSQGALGGCTPGAGTLTGSAVQAVQSMCYSLPCVLTWMAYR